MKKNLFKTLFYLITTISILLTGCQKKEEELNKYTASTINAGFDTFIQLVAYTKTEEEFNDYFKIVEEEFLKHHKLYDIYHTYDGMNNLKTVNDSAGIAPVKVDKEIIDMLLFAKTVQTHEDEFDITAGSLLKIWHNYREDGQNKNESGEYGSLPTSEELQEAAKYIGMKYLEIDEENSTVYLNDPHARLDVGGLAKGYTAEVVAKMLIEKGLKHGAVNAGGNLRTIGLKPDGNPWSTGVVSPANDGSYCSYFDSPVNSSIVTSGDYQNYYIAEDGNVYHHITDLDTLAPVHYYRGVTIITDDSGMADLLSTTLFNEPIEEAIETIKRFKDTFNIGLEVIFVTDKTNDYGDLLNHYQTEKFNIYYTDGLKDTIRQK